jgi:hypothetical protein
MPLPPATPGVYVDEATGLPPGVVEAASAVPAFIGYTQMAPDPAGADLRDRAVLVGSMREFEQRFGGPPTRQLQATVSRLPGGEIRVAVTEPPFGPGLHPAMALYFANGGGPAWVCSVGQHDGGVARADFMRGLQQLAALDAPTLLLAPEAVLLPAADYALVVQAMLAQCEMRGDRFAILDAQPGGPLAAGQSVLDAIALARAAMGSAHLQCGALYFPFLRTALAPALQFGPSGVNGANVALSGAVSGTLDALADAAIAAAVRAELARTCLVLPPSPALAGVYVAVDATRGVWKAPANISLTQVIEPVLAIDDRTQESLNLDPGEGKSVNALRAFPGKGSLVWGARTLAGNDNEWRYVPVRRFFLMVETSIRRGSQWVVFEPNDANTWVRLRGMVENYLTQKWRQGALAGATPAEAFFVRCGLGQTMSSQDVLEGRLILELGMAMIRPAEFIVLRLTLPMQAAG